MKTKLLNKILLANKTKLPFIFSSVGFLFGLLLLLLSLQAYFQIKQLLSPAANATDYLILNKSVNVANSLFFARPAFSEQEIKDLSKQSFVKDMGIFTSNQFTVSTVSNSQIPLYTDLFFESVPVRFIENTPSNWDWKAGQAIVPIIISQDLLNLYNFGFALGQGLPQLSQSTIQLFTIPLKIKGIQKDTLINAKIVGFSDRIPSIIVPEPFIQHTNQFIGENKIQQPSRLIIQVNNSANTEIVQYLSQQNYQLNQDKIQASKAAILIQFALSAISLIGIAFIALSFILFSTNLQLLIAEAKNEIQLLLQLGYPAQTINYHLLIFSIILLSTISITAFLLFFLLNNILNHFLIDNSLQINTSAHFSIYLTPLILIFVATLLNTLSIKYLIKKLQ